ncbi:hypothetical protein RJ640_016080 [Escallonia rubra]|uniref:Telomeric single stranded DNA binding POT1/Cdc13 domain-containing protein n=1 Tax=Escallonia rubra TaxID=112253 RepID=A0AA88UPX6_9ASTE|nr:hypothetical protein RJ640_016080 [Escallonia rubra]
MASMERDEDYKFLPIVDAMASINQRVNLFGVVLETSIPKQSKGTDCFCTLKIVDESRPGPGISVNVFAETVDMLPQVESAGDIIQLSHVVLCAAAPRAILHVYKLEVFLWASDGGRGPDDGVTSYKVLEDEMENPLPLRLEPFCLSRDVLCLFPAVGTVLRVVVDRGNAKLGLHLLKTETDYPDVPFVTLMNVLTHSEVTAKFRCVVRVIAAFPWQAADFRSPTGTYRIRLTLEDPTARIHAFLYAEDGVNFFGGYPSVDSMTRKLNALLGVAESEFTNEFKGAPRNPPWVQCCLKSYYIHKNDIWRSRNYQIFATQLPQFSNSQLLDRMGFGALIA